MLTVAGHEYTRKQVSRHVPAGDQRCEERARRDVNNVKSPDCRSSHVSVGRSPGIWGSHSHRCACSNVREGWGAKSSYRVEDGLNEVFLLFEEKTLLILGLGQ